MDIDSRIEAMLFRLEEMEIIKIKCDRNDRAKMLRAMEEAMRFAGLKFISYYVDASKEVKV